MFYAWFDKACAEIARGEFTTRDEMAALMTKRAKRGGKPRDVAIPGSLRPPGIRRRAQSPHRDEDNLTVDVLDIAGRVDIYYPGRA